MNKAQLKEFAIYSRNKLRSDVYGRLLMLHIDEDGIRKPQYESLDLLTFSNEYKLHDDDVNKYNRLVYHLETLSKDKQFNEVLDDFVEEVAYTWFNRIIALRYMEINNYMPHGFRVLSSPIENILEPEILRNYNYLNIGLSNKEIETLNDLSFKGDVISQNKMFELLFLKQCHSLNNQLPELFEKTEDFKDLLLILSFTDPQSVIYKLVNEVSVNSFDINSKDGSGQIEIIGWLYQYYNSEKKDEVIDVIKKSSIRKEDIPAATQIFTPQWIVKYMVDNSLGKYWLERNPDSFIKDDLEYLIKDNIDIVGENINPTDITFLDNAMGSGHILVYAFDVLMQIYTSEGYQPRDAAISILENNLYGLDIDKRAYQLSYFALMMKARQHNTRILNQNIKLNIYYFEDVKEVDSNILNQFGESFNDIERQKLTLELADLINLFGNSTELGSIMLIPDYNLKALEEFINDYDSKKQLTLESMDINLTQKALQKMIKISKILQQKYEAVVTNPPYMGKFKSSLSNYINTHYKDYKGDLFSVFIYRNIEMCVSSGYVGFMTPMVWMFIKTYEKLREHIILNKHISSLIQLEYSAFEEATVPICTFTVENTNSTTKGSYIRLSDFTGGMAVQNKKTIEAINNYNVNYYYSVYQKDYYIIPGNPIAYWVGKSFFINFEKGISIDEISDFTGSQNKTANNKKYLRNHWEVANNKVGRDYKWIFYAKGGNFRKYYGNLDLIIDWSESARNYYSDNPTSNLLDKKYWFQEGITYTMLTTKGSNFRYFPNIGVFDMGGPTICKIQHQNYIMGLLNSNVAELYFNVFNPTLNLQIKDVKSLPIIIEEKSIERVEIITQKSIDSSRLDWNLNETSWDFKSNMLLDNNIDGLIETAYEKSKEIVNNNFNQLKLNEEELNRVFIEIYGLEDELDPYVSDRDITITKIFDESSDIDEEIKGNRYVKTREDIIKEYISYAVGCMMGRYSLDIEGLAYAGGEFDYSKYNTFKQQEDNVLIISDELGIESSILERFIEFVKVSFGEANLDDNLEYIANSLYKNGTVRERINRYFNNDFYNDHVRRYQKTPIYWLYDSGASKTKRQQKNAFKALVYVHRYNGNTTGNVRVNYLHEVQKSYERELSILENELLDPSIDAKLRRENQARINVLEAKIKELRDYDELIGHLAIDNIEIDLDDGITVNHEKVQTDRNNKKYNILTKIG